VVLSAPSKACLHRPAWRPDQRLGKGSVCDAGQCGI